MNRFPGSKSCLGFFLAAVLIGCSHKQDTKTELEKAASELAQAETNQPPPPTEPAPSEAPAPAPISGLAPEPEGAPPATPAKQMQQALTAYNAHQLEDAVTRLQRLRSMPTLTAEQRMAVQDSVAAVMSEIYDLASKGDARAIAAVKQYEEMQTQPH